jgi:hypothetical protein
MLEDRRTKETQLLDNAISGTAQLSLADTPGPSTSEPKARPKTPKQAEEKPKRRASAKPEMITTPQKRPPMAPVRGALKSQASVRSLKERV